MSQAVWNSLTTYVVNDIVEYGGQVFRALTINTNAPPVITPPGPSTEWDFLGQTGGGGVNTLTAGQGISVTGVSNVTVAADLTAGPGITLTPTGNSIEIEATGSGGSIAALPPLQITTPSGVTTVGTLPSDNNPGGGAGKTLTTGASEDWASSTGNLTLGQWQAVYWQATITVTSPGGTQAAGEFSVTFTNDVAPPAPSLWEPVSYFSTPATLPNNLTQSGCFVVRGQGAPLLLGANGFAGIDCQIAMSGGGAGTTALLCVPIPNPP